MAFLGMFQMALAQPGEGKEPEMRDRMEAYRAQFITEQLDLSPEEAQQFWPIYNQYRKELDEIHHTRMKKHRRSGGDAKERMESMTDSEIQKSVEEEFEMQQKLLDIRKAYFQKFKKVLPMKKVGLLYMAEGDFQRRLIRKLGDRKHPPRE